MLYDKLGGNSFQCVHIGFYSAQDKSVIILIGSIEEITFIKKHHLLLYVICM